MTSDLSALQARAEQLLKDIPLGPWDDIADLIRDLLTALSDQSWKLEEWSKQHTAALQLHIEAERELDEARVALSDQAQAHARLVEQWQAKADGEHAQAVEYNHRGQQALDAYWDGKHMARRECAADLSALTAHARTKEHLT